VDVHHVANVNVVSSNLIGILDERWNLWISDVQTIATEIEDGEFQPVPMDNMAAPPGLDSHREKHSSSNNAVFWVVFPFFSYPHYTTTFTDRNCSRGCSGFVYDMAVVLASGRG
jgi:hypothetical protein